MDKSLLDFCLDFYFNNCQLVNGPLWFLICLFNINVIFFTLYSFLNNDYLILFISVTCGIIGLYFSYQSVKIPMNIDTALTCVPFFYFGYFIKNHTKIIIHTTRDNKLIWYSIVCGLSLTMLTGDVEFHTNSISQSSFLTVHIAGIIGTLMVILLSKRIGKIFLLSYLGRYSIIILCTHLLLIELFLPFFIRFLAPVPCLFVLFIIIIISELILIPSFIKYLPYVTAQKDLFP